MNSALGKNESDPDWGPLEIGHVLLMDIVRYFLLPTDKQIDATRQFQRVVEQSLDQLDLALMEGKKTVILPTGDGMAIAFFDEPLAPLLCARKIRIALKAEGVEFAVTMGIRYGPIYRHADINANSNVAGSGINLAQRVMNSGRGLCSGLKKCH